MISLCTGQEQKISCYVQLNDKRTKKLNYKISKALSVPKIYNWPTNTLKGRSTLLFIREIQIETTIKYFTPT